MPSKIQETLILEIIIKYEVRMPQFMNNVKMFNKDYSDYIKNKWNYSYKHLSKTNFDKLKKYFKEHE